MKTKKISAKPTKRESIKTKHKYYVLDTNVILHDWRSFLNFHEHNVILPIAVIEEIDKFKSGYETVNYNAREFTRELDVLINGGYLNQGCKLPDGGFLRVVTKIDDHKEMRDARFSDSMDHRILAVAISTAKENPTAETILVSKDMNLRLKAKSLGLQAEDYTTDKAPISIKQYTGITTIDGLEAEFINRIYAEEVVCNDQLVEMYEPFPNEYFVFKSYTGQSAICRYDKRLNAFSLVESRNAYGIHPRNVEQICALDALLNPAITLVTLSGTAGAGKTLLTLAAALENKRQYRQIIITKSVIPVQQEQLGFMPGDLEEKLSPVFQSYFDNLDVIKHNLDEKNTQKDKDKLQNALDQEKIKMVALAHMRGRTFAKNFIILDEAQNNTALNTKTVVTRVGEGSKLVLMGDTSQIDSPYLDELSNGLSHVINKFKDQECHAHITFSRGERSALAELASKLL